MGILIAMCVVAAIIALVYFGVKESKEITTEVTNTTDTIKTDISTVKSDISTAVDNTTTQVSDSIKKI